ncbi:sperm-associated antigen 16 protein-like [Scleropages formosus]|uniref:Sperm-associated antigen 16 protein-like n=1 Tax=Scleropages formosus TaxID=113540 RepID=A0A0P7X4L6_SCLFO|nr:sperm-associated antigen 16 protein [Scleropages formosus]KPP71724.1 sperm-associated antigen 16 protein-like [Scleropages formosus]
MATEKEMEAPEEAVEEAVEGPFYLENVLIPEESEDSYQYEEVALEDDWSLTEGEEDLEAALKAIGSRTEDIVSVEQATFSGKPPVSHIPEALDDFLRNFLVKMGMRKTLDCFQTEWYEMAQRGSLNTELVGFVPHAYMHSQLLEQEVKSVERERDDYRKASFEAAETLVKLQKERDFHRMQHKRVVQEKNALVKDIRRLKKHYASYESALRQLNDKYKVALKQKMFTGLERDKALEKLHSLEVCAPSVRGSRAPQSLGPRSVSCAHQSEGKRKSRATKWDGLQAASAGPSGSSRDPSKSVSRKWPKDSEFPVDAHTNASLSQAKTLSSHAPHLSDFCLTGTLHGHTLPISCLALHPHKKVIATASDDHQWKVWDVSTGEVIMAKHGHSDWLSGCCFHPNGGSLATASGDTTVKVWDFLLGRCLLTLQGHTHAAWGCSFHSCGLFLASCSMDNTAKVWDLQSERCRATLRGHADSVNSVAFLPFSNMLLTCSADKTLSLWDARTSLCTHTFYGHLYSCNYAAFNTAGDSVASCDSHGAIKLWDIRKAATVTTLDAGPRAGNQVAFSPSGHVLAVASDDGTVKLVELTSMEVCSLGGHSDAVQSVVFDHKGENLLSGGSDGTVAIWSGKKCTPVVCAATSEKLK